MEFGNMEELIFGESSELFFDENAGEEISDEELNEFGIIETGEEPEVAGYAIALENEQNFNAIMNAMMVKEYACLESTGTELVYTEGAIGDFFEAVKTTIKRWWGKFAEMIKKAQDKIIKYTRENGAFVKKYKGKDMKAPSQGTMDVEGYTYSNLQSSGPTLISVVAESYRIRGSKFLSDLNADSSEKIEDVKTAIEDYVEKFDDGLKEKLNARAGTKDKALAEAVKAYYRGKKQKITVKGFKDLIKEMDQAAEIRKHLKNDYDAAKKASKELLKSVHTMQKSCDRKDDTEKARLAATKPLVSLLKKTMNAMGKVQSVSIQVYYEKCKADRAMAMWIINHQPKKATKESTVENEGLGIVLV